MSVERLNGTVELVCDDCGEAWPETHEADDLPILRSDAKEVGWRSFKRKGKWHDACPDCVRDWVAQGAPRAANPNEDQGRLL